MARRRTRTQGEPGRPPAFQFYVKAWLSSTRGMPLDAKGAYVDLLAWSWDNPGPIPDDAGWRRQFFGVSASAAARVWRVLGPKFARVRGGLINERLEAQRRELAVFVERAKKGASARWQATPEHVPSTTQASPEHAPSMAQASPQAMLNGCTPYSVLRTPEDQEQDQKQPGARRPVFEPPFKVYAAVAKHVIKTHHTDDLGALAEGFKRACAAQGFAYNADITQRALDAARTAPGRKGAQ